MSSFVRLWRRGDLEFCTSRALLNVPTFNKEKTMKSSLHGNWIKVRIAVLNDEIEVLKSRIEPHDTGHLYTTISTLEHRIKELESKE